uniref:Uncharacterized protein n=1 Tax=Alexandrium catenella TaxID=2925 RepID=A0A7S1KY04_ALECA|mmetsp:Transcript_101448/g.269763  ORF Transcript_101448/g.269763 Transcript_101448/m.269763 type:complete len:215 (+) Transcript_101448:58-702(+)
MVAIRRKPSAVLSGVLLAGSTLYFASGPAFRAGPARTAEEVASAISPSTQQLVIASNALLLANLPEPAHAGGMFDFGVTLPFVALTFLAMMAALNALWYAPVTSEMDDRNDKLLQTLSESTDMLTEADEIQVEYTEQIRVAREQASKAVAAYRKKTEESIDRQLRSAAAEREQKAAEVKVKLDVDVEGKMKAAESEIQKRKTVFVKETLAAVSM